MKNSNDFLTQQEKKNPIGIVMTEALSDKQIIEKLKEVDFLTDDLKLTRRGKEYVMGKLETMDNVERLMIERFTLEHHGVEANIPYND